MKTKSILAMLQQTHKIYMHFDDTQRADDIDFWTIQLLKQDDLSTHNIIVAAFTAEITQNYLLESKAMQMLRLKSELEYRFLTENFYQEDMNDLVERLLRINETENYQELHLDIAEKSLTPYFLPLK